MGKHIPPARKVFAISRCLTSNPLIEGWSGVVYTKHYIQLCSYKCKPRYYIVDMEITKELALQLIKKFKMKVCAQDGQNILWDTTPSLQDECKRLGLTYSQDLRPY